LALVLISFVVSEILVCVTKWWETFRDRFESDTSSIFPELYCNPYMGFVFMLELDLLNTGIF